MFMEQGDMGICPSLFEIIEAGVRCEVMSASAKKLAKRIKRTKNITKKSLGEGFIFPPTFYRLERRKMLRGIVPPLETTRVCFLEPLRKPSFRAR